MVEGDLILGRYRPLQLKGEGASGTVELCWDTRIQRRVAIKRLPLNDAESADGASGTVPGLAEARTGAMLSHPTIVNVIDFEVEGDEALLIMEAIEGPSLAQLIDEDPDRVLSLNVAAAVARAVGDALDYAHENQVLHLDIKPDNILVDRAGLVRVSDFGISELADAQGFGQAVGGTIGYMPPEQINGDDLDQRCDEFAFAAVMYELLTGENPFNARSVDASLQLIENFDFAPPSEFRDDIDGRADAVIIAALDPRREMRYDTVLDFLYALEPYLGDERAGTAELKALAEPDDESALPAAETGAGAGAPASSAIIRRVAMLLLCWLCAGLGCAQSGLLDVPLAFGIALVAGALGAAVPAAGTLLALLLLGAGWVCRSLPLLLAGNAGPMEPAWLALGVAWVLSAVLVFAFHLRETRVSSVLGCACAIAVPVAVLAATHALAGDAEGVLALVWRALPVVASSCLAVCNLVCELARDAGR